VRDASRGRRLRTVAIAASFLILIAFLVLQYRAGLETQAAQHTAEEASLTAKRRLAENLLDEGRRALLDNRSSDALHALSQARTLGIDSPALSFMLERAARPLDAQRAVLDAQRGKVWHVAYSPDGKTILAADDHGATLWDATTRRARHRLEGPGAVHAIAFTPDANTIITGDDGGQLRLWRLDGSLRTRLDGHAGRIVSPAVSKDGRVACSAESEGTVRVWDLKAGTSLGKFAGVSGTCALTHDGARVATGIGTGVAAWEIATQTKVFERATTSEASTVAFDTRGARIVASVGGTAYVWSLGQEGDLQLPHGEELETAAFSPDDRWIVTAGRDGTGRVWDANDGALGAVLRGHRGAINSAAISSDSRRIVTASADMTAIVWERTTGRRITTLEGHAGSIVTARFGVNDGEIATGSWDGTVRLWDPREAYLQATVQARHASGALAGCSLHERPTGFVLPLACGDAARTWDVRTGALAEIRAKGYPTINAAGDRLVLVDDKVAEVWDLRERRSLGRLTHTTPITDAMFGPDNRTFAVRLADGALRIARDAEVLRDVPGNTPLTSIAFAPDSRSIIVADEREVRVVRLDVTSVIRLDERRRVDTLVVSPDGRRLVAFPIVPPAPDVHPSLWDLETGRKIATLTGHKQLVFGASFDRTGTRIATASGDATAMLWDANDGRALGTLAGSPQYLHAATFSPDGHTVVTIGGDGVLRFWDPVSMKVLWVLDAHRGAAFLATYLDATHLISQGVRSDIMLWEIPQTTTADVNRHLGSAR
jgi:WD40 repeat protein